MSPPSPAADASNKPTESARNAAPVAKKDSGGKSGRWFPSGIGIIMFLAAIVRLANKGCNGDSANTKKAAAKQVSVQQVQNVEKPWAQPQAQKLARIAVSAQDGTMSLQALTAQLPDDQLALLGLRAVLTGTDTYGVHVRVRNSGTAPVRVIPTNFRVHFGLESTYVMTCAHPVFLQPCVLNPGQTVVGLVMYDARIDAGAVIRLLGTAFTYDDSSVVVEYR